MKPAAGDLLRRRRAAGDDSIVDRRLALSVLPLLFAAPARADVTVFFAPPPPRVPLFAEPVCPPPADGRVDPAPWSEASAAIALAPTEFPEGEPEAEAPASSEASSDGAPRGDEPAGAREVDEAAPAVALEPAPDALTTGPSLASALEPQPAEAAPDANEASAPLRFVRVGDGSGERIELRLLDAQGRPSPEALAALSILARPRDAAPPSEDDVAAHAGDLEWVATGIRRLHPGLLVRLDAIARHFGAERFEIVLGYRPDARETSRHRIGSALDLRLVGVSVEELDAFAATLPETGVGLYPTSRFVHLDVRERRTHWVDLSGPGEPTDTAALTPPPADPVDEAAILAAFREGLRGLEFGR